MYPLVVKTTLENDQEEVPVGVVPVVENFDVEVDHFVDLSLEGVVLPV